MTMKKTLLLLTLLVLCASAVSAAKLKYDIKYDNVLIFGNIKSENERKSLEKAFAKEFRSWKIKAVKSMDIKMENKVYSEADLEEIAKANNIDTLLEVKILSREGGGTSNTSKLLNFAAKSVFDIKEKGATVTLKFSTKITDMRNKARILDDTPVYENTDEYAFKSKEGIFESLAEDIVEKNFIEKK